MRGVASKPTGGGGLKPQPNNNSYGDGIHYKFILFSVFITQF